jgi:hypothetical protein
MSLTEGEDDVQLIVFLNRNMKAQFFEKPENVELLFER